MGVSNSMEIFQEENNSIFQLFEFILIHIDNLIIIKYIYWGDNLEKIDLMLDKLK